MLREKERNSNDCELSIMKYGLSKYGLLLIKQKYKYYIASLVRIIEHTMFTQTYEF